MAAESGAISILVENGGGSNSESFENADIVMMVGASPVIKSEFRETFANIGIAL